MELWGTNFSEGHLRTISRDVQVLCHQILHSPHLLVIAIAVFEAIQPVRIIIIRFPVLCLKIPVPEVCYCFSDTS